MREQTVSNYFEVWAELSTAVTCATRDGRHPVGRRRSVDANAGRIRTQPSVSRRWLGRYLVSSAAPCALWDEIHSLRRVARSSVQTCDGHQYHGACHAPQNADPAHCRLSGDTSPALLANERHARTMFLTL